MNNAKPMHISAEFKHKIEFMTKGSSIHDPVNPDLTWHRGPGGWFIVSITPDIAFFQIVPAHTVTLDNDEHCDTDPAYPDTVAGKVKEAIGEWVVLSSNYGGGMSEEAADQLARWVSTSLGWKDLIVTMNGGEKLPIIDALDKLTADTEDYPTLYSSQTVKDLTAALKTILMGNGLERK